MKKLTKTENTIKGAIMSIAIKWTISRSRSVNTTKGCNQMALCTMI